MTTLAWGDLAAQKVSQRIATPVANIAALKALPTRACTDLQRFYTVADGKSWMFSLSSSVTGDDQLIVAPTANVGRFLCIDTMVKLVLPFDKTTADAAVLYTVPTGAEIACLGFLWNVGTSFTGGTNSAIGVSSGTLTGYTTKGDLLGGVGGDVAATLVSTGAKYKAGTVGAQFGTGTLRDKCVMVAADTIRFDRIVDAFTAGVGNVVVRAQLFANAGA